MKKLFNNTFLLLLLLLPATSLAYDFEYNGIYYNKNGTEAIVTFKDNSYNSYSGYVNIPASFKYDGRTYTVTTIGYEAFQNCSNLIMVEIPNTVTCIETRAFFKCSNLANVNIPNSVTDISGVQTFGYCSSLKSFSIPGSITEIGDYMFEHCSGLTSVTIPNSVTTIGQEAFWSCSGLTNIDIPNSVTTIKSDAFHECSGLTSVIIPNSVITLEGSAFRGCSELTSVTLPNSITSINSGLFYDCTQLASIELPKSITSIGKSAFRNTALTSIIIPNAVTSIGDKAFCDCALEEIYCMAIEPPLIEKYTFSEYVASGSSGDFIGKYDATLYVPIGSENDYKVADYWENFTNILGISIIGDFEVDGIYYRALSDNTAMVIKHPEEDNFYREDIVIPDSVTYQDMIFSVIAMDDGAFDGCDELNSVVIGNAMETIGEEAFQGCTSLTSVTLGSSVVTIGAKAFNYCNALQTVTCLGTVPPVMENSNCFSSVAYRDAVLLVQPGFIETYNAADYWYKFEKIREIGTFEKGDVNGDGEVNIADINAVIDMILSGSSSLAGDVNGDGEVNIADINAVIDIILSH